MDPPSGVPELLQDAPGSTKHAIWGLVRKYCPQIEEYSKYSKKKQVFFWHFFLILTIFRSLCLFGAILAQKLNSFICKKKIWFFFFFVIRWCLSIYFCSNLYGRAPRGPRGVKKSDFFLQIKLLSFYARIAPKRHKIPKSSKLKKNVKKILVF